MDCGAERCLAVRESVSWRDPQGTQGGKHLPTMLGVLISGEGSGLESRRVCKAGEEHGFAAERVQYHWHH